MRKILTIVFCLAITVSAFAGGKSELKWKRFTEGFAEAKKSNKKIMLDVYTDWCKWCKVLDTEVYGNETVSEYLSKQYIVVKLNAESNDTVRYNDEVYTSGQMAQALNVQGYPKIIFFEPDGKPLTSLDGYVPVDKFLPVIKFIGEDYYKKMTWPEYQAQQAGSESKNKSKK